MNDPAFSVLIPAHNAERTLASAIRSALAQTRQDFELIVIDDGSTDGTRAIASRFARSDTRLRVVSHERNRGPASARNSGIACSRAPVVALLDADDLWMPRYLEVMGNALGADPRAGLAYTEGWLLDDASGRIMRAPAMARWKPPIPPPASPEAFLRELVRRNFVLYAVALRRSALEVVGGFDPSLSHAEDYELWLRMLAHGYRAARSPGMLVIRRDRADSLSKDAVAMDRALIEAMRLVIDEHPAPEDVKAIARRRMTKTERKITRLEATGRPAWPARARAVLGRIKRRVLGDRLYYPELPPEVARAFGDLRQV